MLLADYHTHTTYSHGKGSPEDNVRAAIARGLSCIAISEHGPKHIVFPVSFKRLKLLKRDIEELKEKYRGQIDIQMGLEANLLGDGQTDVPEDTSLFDFVLFGYHRGVYPGDAVSRRWLRQLLTKRGSAADIQENTRCYVHAMQRTKKLLAVTHPNTYIPIDIKALAIAAAQHDVALEINQAHGVDIHAAMLKEAQAQGASFLISSDAHRPQDVGVCGRAIRLAEEAGVLGSVRNWRP